MTQVLRPLTLGELLDRAFSLYRKHVLLFAGLVALPNLLVAAASIINTSTLARNDPNLSTLLVQFAALAIIGFVSMVTMSISQAATMVAVSRLHLNEPITIAGAFAGLKGRVFRVCVLSLTLTLLTLLGLVLLILPGVFLALRWSLAIPAAVLEGASLRQAMSRSATLIEGQYGRVFMIGVLYFLLVFIFAIAVYMPFLVGHLVTGGTLADTPLWLDIVTDVGEFFTQCLVGPLATISIALVYYDSRVRKEAFDLEHMLAQLKPAPDQPVMTT